VFLDLGKDLDTLAGFFLGGIADVTVGSLGKMKGLSDMFNSSSGAMAFILRLPKEPVEVKTEVVSVAD
jgi:hypothetical protein